MLRFLLKSSCFLLLSIVCLIKDLHRQEYSSGITSMLDFNIGMDIDDDSNTLSKVEIIRLYKSGTKVKAIAKRVRKSPATIYTILYKNGVKLNNVGRPKKISIIPNETKKAVKLRTASISNQNSRLKIILKEIVMKNQNEPIDSLVEKISDAVCQWLRG